MPGLAGTAARAVGAFDLARSLFEDRLTAARLTFAGSPTDRRLVVALEDGLVELAAWLVVVILERLQLTRHIWHLPLFFLALVVLFYSAIGLALAP